MDGQVTEDEVVGGRSARNARARCVRGPRPRRLAAALLAAATLGAPSAAVAEEAAPVGPPPLPAGARTASAPTATSPRPASATPERGRRAAVATPLGPFTALDLAFLGAGAALLAVLALGLRVITAKGSEHSDRNTRAGLLTTR